MVPDDDRGNSCRGDAEILVHGKEQGLVGDVVVDFELFKVEIRVPGLYFRNEWLDIITMVAPIAIEKIPGYGMICTG